MSRRARWAIAIAAPLVHGLMYGAANRYPRVAPTELPLTAFDRAVPFVPDTVWVYLSDYLMVLVAFLICRATLRFTATFAAVIAVSTAVQWLVPIAYPRGLFPVAPADGLASQVVALVWSVDGPGSCFPSLHVAVTAASAIAVVRHPPAWAPRAAGAVMLLWTFAVCVSTLTVKQHYAIDVAGGLAVAGAVHLLESPVARFWAVRRRAPRAPGAPAGRGERASG